jgi:hypothetical protein
VPGDPELETLLQGAALEPLADFRSRVEAALADKPTALTVPGPWGLQEISLTRNDIAAFEAQLVSSNRLAELEALVTRAKASAGSPTETTETRVALSAGTEPGSFDTEDKLLVWSDRYRLNQILYEGLENAGKRWITQAAICLGNTASWSNTFSGAYELAEAVSNIGIFLQDLLPIFLREIKVQPPSVTLAPSESLSFRVFGEFSSGSSIAGLVDRNSPASATAKELIKAWLVRLVKRMYGSDALPCSVDVYSNLPTLGNSNLSKLDDLVDQIFNAFLRSVGAEKWLAVIDKLIRENLFQQSVALTGRTVQYVKVGTGYEIRPPGAASVDWQVSAGPKETSGNPKVLFSNMIEPGALGLGEKGLLYGSAGVSLVHWLIGIVDPARQTPPTARIVVSASGQAELGGNPVTLLATADGFIYVTLSAASSDPGYGTMRKVMWYAGKTAVGQGEAVTVKVLTGQTTFECSLENSAGVSARGTVTIVVNPPSRPSARLLLTALNASGLQAGPTVPDGATLTVTVAPKTQAVIRLDGSRSQAQPGLKSYVWDADGRAIGSGTILSTPLSAGTHNIGLTVTDNSGQSDGTSAFVRVVEMGPPVASFRVVGPNAMGREGETLTFDVAPGAKVNLVGLCSRICG